MKTDHIQLRVSAAEKRAIRAAAGRAGMDMSEWILARVLPRGTQLMTTKVQALARCSGANEQAFALADLHDLLADLPRRELLEVLEAPLGQQLTPFAANYLAAMIELRCHQERVVPPAWVGRIPALDEPYFSTALIGLRPYLLKVSPPPFKRRNLFIDTSLGGRV